VTLDADAFDQLRLGELRHRCRRGRGQMNVEQLALPSHPEIIDPASPGVYSSTIGVCGPGAFSSSLSRRLRSPRPHWRSTAGRAGLFTNIPTFPTTDASHSFASNTRRRPTAFGTAAGPHGATATRSQSRT